MKCFWCGQDDTRHSRLCASCGRDLNWSRFFRGVLKPKVGLLSGDPDRTHKSTRAASVWR